MTLVKGISLLFAAATWIAIAEAQDPLPVLPSCATSCLTTFEGDSPSANTTCSDLDIKCICQDDTYLGSMICCLHESCSNSDRESAESYAKSLCKSMGTTLSQGLGCSTNGPSSATASATSATSASGNSLPTETDVKSSESSTRSAGGSSENSSGSSGSSSSSSSSSHNETSHSSKAGLGVGLGVGLPAAAAILGGFVYLLRRKKNPPAGPTKAPVLTNGINELPGGSNHSNFQFQPQPSGTHPHAELAAYGALEKNEAGNMGITAVSSPAHEQPLQHQPHSELPGHAPPPVHELPLTEWQQPELPGSTVPPVHELPLNLRFNQAAPGNQP